MTEWAILAAAITGAPSVAAVVVALIVSKHRKWADARAAEAAREAAKHHHVWGMWEEHSVSNWGSPFAPNQVADTRTEFRRRCDVCGDIESKTWSERDRTWMP